MLNALKRLYRNTLFRLTLLAAGLFVVSSIVSLSYVYYATVLSELRRVDEDILTEIRELEALYRTEGPIAVQGEVILRMTSGEGLYLFRTENFGGRPIMSGNINEFPEADNKPRIGLLQSRFGNDYRTVEFELTFRDSEASDLQARRSRAIASPLKIDERVSGVLIVGTHSYGYFDISGFGDDFGLAFGMVCLAAVYAAG